MESLDMESLEAMLAKARELQAVLRETPEILAFFRLAKDTNGEAVILPMPADRLIRAGEAAKILCVDKGTIYRYEREGKLEAWRTDGSSQKKFWLKKVMALAERIP